MVPSTKQVEQARQLLARYLSRTRLVRADSLESRSGARVYLKIESDLPTSSFKPRGALYALLTNAAQRALAGSSPPVLVITVLRLLMRLAWRTSRDHDLPSGKPESARRGQGALVANP